VEGQGFAQPHPRRCPLTALSFFVHRIHTQQGACPPAVLTLVLPGGSRQAVNDDRVFVMDDRWTAVSSQGIVDPSPGGRSKCPNIYATQPWECFFRPLSGCTVADALALANVLSVDELLSSRWEYTYATRCL